jgi:hypothetical protein
MSALLHSNEGRPLSDDNNNTKSASDADCSSRFASRLSNIELSNCGAGVCTTVQVALNAHLVLLGDYISKIPEASINGTTRTNHSNNTARITQNDEDVEIDDSSTSLLHWFYYDQPETPIHPALEYETGHLLSSVPSRGIIKFENDETVTNDAPLQVTNRSNSSTSLRNINQYPSEEYERIKWQRQSSSPLFISNHLKLKASLLFLTVIASFSVITAKFQSIPM